jgi:hypothetical protein
VYSGRIFFGSDITKHYMVELFIRDVTRIFIDWSATRDIRIWYVNTYRVLFGGTTKPRRITIDTGRSEATRLVTEAWIWFTAHNFNSFSVMILKFIPLSSHHSVAAFHLA